MCAYPLMSSVLAKWSLSGTPAIFLSTLQENEYISLLLSQSFSVSAKLTFTSILPLRLLPSLSSSNIFCPLWPPWVFFWRPDWSLSVPFSSPTERSKFFALLFFFLLSLLIMLLLCFMWISNCCNDCPEQGEKPSCSDSHLVSSMQNRGAVWAWDTMLSVPR